MLFLDVNVGLSDITFEFSDIVLGSLNINLGLLDGNSVLLFVGFGLHRA